MNTWMNNKFNKQEFPTGNVKQIILRSALNFNQSLSTALVLLGSPASAESALGKPTNSLGRRHRVHECRRQGTIRRSCAACPCRASLPRSLLVVSALVERHRALVNHPVVLLQLHPCCYPYSGIQKLRRMAQVREHVHKVNRQDRATPGNRLPSPDIVKTWMNGEIASLSVKTIMWGWFREHGVFILGSITSGSEVGFGCLCLGEPLFSS